MNTRRIANVIALALGCIGGIAHSASPGNELLLSGAVESVDRAGGTIVVLGHRLAVRDASSYLPGHLVNVYGTLLSDGTAKAATVQNTQNFVASGDPVSVVGVVRSVDRSSGLVTVDGSRIDYTQLLGNARFALPSIGDSVMVAGIQPSGRGVVLANQIVRMTGVSGNGNALGVSGNGNALGVSGNGNALGVSGNGHALGVSGNGNALGVSGNGNALGVSGNGNALGVSGNGHGLGVSGNGNALGVSGNGNALGVSGNGNALGVSGNGHGLGVSGNGNALGVSGNGHGLGVSGNGNALGVSGNGHALGVSGNGNALGVSGNGSAFGSR